MLTFVLKNLRIISCTFLWIREKARGLLWRSNKILRMLRSYFSLSDITMSETWLWHFAWWYECILILKIPISRSRLMTILIVFLIFFSHCWILPFIEHPFDHLFAPFWDLFDRAKRIRWVVVPSVDIVVTRESICFLSKVLLLRDLRLRGISNALGIMVDAVRIIRNIWRCISVICTSIVGIIRTIAFVSRM